MFPTINKKETGVNLRRIMDMRGVGPMSRFSTS